MPIILSQRIDVESEYEDVPFARYHFPKRYIRQLKSGDRFVYYQGDRQRRDRRYYYGCGVVGNITPDVEGSAFFAEILDGCRFPQNVPIYDGEGGFVESLGFAEIRNSENPPWQQSIRKLSEAAYESILTAALVPANSGSLSQIIESQTDDLQVLEILNAQYMHLDPTIRDRRIATYLDRGTAVTRALKRILGSTCQVCGWHGFRKPDGTDYIEAHHLVQVAAMAPNSLCTDNV
ncbi:MAG: hypothetical protein ABGZ35_17520, partial [Planctomycetaceae bacterium]